MPLNPQTANFPPISLVERSWNLDLRTLGRTLNPTPAVANGLYLGIPLSGGQPTTGLTPTLTAGYLLDEDRVHGPFGDLLVTAAPVNAVRNLYFGLNGVYWAATPTKTTDVLIGSVSTDNQSTPSIMHTAQLRRSLAGYYIVRGLIGLQRCAKGADVDLFTFTKPAGFNTMRLVRATATVVAGTTAGNTAGDDFLFKVGSTTLVTIDDAALPTAATTIGTEASAFYSTASSLAFKYNQTDTSTAIAGGLIEVNAVIDLY
jgi:hypothetical protein